MRSGKRTALGSCLLALVSQAAAQVANLCPTNDVCFQLNIPESTASSGSGDIFFSIAAPSTYEWVALGQGRAMGGSNMFLVYTSSGGSNVTISPRTAGGYSPPTVNSATQLTLLEGSGVSNGVMTANVRCSNCNSWSGGTMDFTAGSGNWIYAYQSSGGPKNSNDQGASISQHNEHSTFTWDFANAKGGNSVNPLISTGTGTGGTPTQSCIPRPASGTESAGAASPTQTSNDSTNDNDNNDDDADDNRGGWPTQYGWPTAKPTGKPYGKRQESLPYCDEVPSGVGNGNSNAGAGLIPIGSSGGPDTRTVLIAHGVLASLAFVILFPIGAITIRLASFPGVVWIHAAFQVFAYIVYIAAFGLGVFLALRMNMLDTYHPIIGIVLLIVLFFQPMSGFLHHLLFKKYFHRTLWSHVHLWIGRLAVTLGIINGGLGLMVADSMNLSSTAGIIAYSVVAALIWVVWVVAIFIGERRRKRAAAKPLPKSTGSQRGGSETGEAIPVEGHYAPSKAQ